MLILPQHHEYKVLLPQPRAEWRVPSAAQVKDCFGNENRRRFRIRARTSDGRPYWQGYFDDREDFDAFIWALITGSLAVERELWRLPTPQWPGIGDAPLVYEFASQIVITSGTTQTSPSDWTNVGNIIEGLGGGGSGGANVSNTSTIACTGGGGSEYRAQRDFSVATPGTTAFNYVIGTGGAAKTVGAGAAGTDTTFNVTALVAKAGGAGANGANPQNGGAGGTGGTGTAGNFNGGAGGASGAFGIVGTGGGGAGGSKGAGDPGVTATAGTTGTDGGNGNAGFGGALGTGASSTSGAPATGTAGGNGVEQNGAQGSGGGGGGAACSSTGNTTGGTGGNYGAGGGGSEHKGSAGSATSGAGGPGILWLTYRLLSPPFPRAGRWWPWLQQ